MLLLALFLLAIALILAIIDMFVATSRPLLGIALVITIVAVIIIVFTGGLPLNVG